MSKSNSVPYMRRAEGSPSPRRIDLELKTEHPVATDYVVSGQFRPNGLVTSKAGEELKEVEHNPHLVD
jgi:hypothetical protein